MKRILFFLACGALLAFGYLVVWGGIAGFAWLAVQPLQWLASTDDGKHFLLVALSVALVAFGYFAGRTDTVGWRSYYLLAKRVCWIKRALKNSEMTDGTKLRAISQLVDEALRDAVPPLTTDQVNEMEREIF